MRVTLLVTTGCYGLLRCVTTSNEQGCNNCLLPPALPSVPPPRPPALPGRGRGRQAAQLPAPVRRWPQRRQRAIAALRLPPLVCTAEGFCQKLN